jgi:DNA-binding beta-propeller fold protein YncE
MILELILAVAPAIALPGGAPVGMDYLAFDRVNERLWVPSGNTGAVNVVDVETGKLHALGGFATAPAAKAGRPNVGPSSVALGAGMAWIGNRGDDTVCAFDGKTLARRACAKLETMPDGLAYVAATHELWATTPRTRSLTIVAVTPATFGVPVRVALEGSPEGYAVDETTGRFYTNLEDKDRTVAVDVKSHKVLASWPTGCGADGPRGLALDTKRQLLFSACTDGAVALDLNRDGAIVGRLETGAGVDNLDYDPKRALLFVASSKEGTLTVARVAKTGALTSAAVVPTAKGARNAVTDARGTAYVADSPDGRIVVVPLPAELR